MGIRWRMVLLLVLALARLGQARTWGYGIMSPFVQRIMHEELVWVGLMEFQGCVQVLDDAGAYAVGLHWDWER
jgi:hypothetical protein